MKVLSLLLLFGSCLVGISPIHQRTENKSNIFVDPKLIRTQDLGSVDSFELPNEGVPLSFINVLADSCSINDAYGSCSASCGAGKAVCIHGHQGVGDRNVFTGASVPEYYSPSCHCTGTGVGSESCSITDAYGSCSASADAGKAICKPGYQGVGDRNVFTGASVPKYYAPTCQLAGKATGTESCSIRDRYGSCNKTCDKRKAVCKAGETIVVEVNIYGLPSRTKDIAPTCQCAGPVPRNE